ncbi:MAG: DUF177 domain-containing protein [Myxococcota bacterium]
MTLKQRTPKQRLMKIDIHTLSMQEHPFSFTLSTQALQEILDRDAEHDTLNRSLFHPIQPFQIEVALYKNDQDEVFFHGQAEGAIGFTCVRSLEPGVMPLCFALQGMSRPTSGIASEDEDPSVYLHKGDCLDLSEVFSEQLFLTLPLNPTCAEDAPLPLEQQSDLECTVKDSSSKATALDPRWEQLRAIQQKLITKKDKSQG